MNTHVNFETAKLAKEKGFDVSVNTLFQHNKDLHKVLPSEDYPHLAHYGKQLDDYTTGYYDWNSLELDKEEKLHKVSGFSESDEDYFTVCCSAPTIAQVIMWLYKKYEIWIRVTPIPYSDNLTHWRWEHMSTNYATRNAGWKKQEDYMSPTEAYEAAILYTLKHLI